MARVGERYYRRDDPNKAILTVLRYDGHMAYMAEGALSTSVQAVHRHELETEWYLLRPELDDVSRSISLSELLHSCMTRALKETSEPAELNLQFQTYLRWAPLSELFDWMTSEWWIVEQDPFFTIASPGAVVRRIVPACLKGMQINFTTTPESSTATLPFTNIFCVGPTPLMALIGLGRIVEAKGTGHAAP